MIEKIAIRNYRLFREFDLHFSPNINILVGDNDTGKSTLIEAIVLALTCRVQGRSLTQGLSPYFFNQEATEDYVKALRDRKNATPPEITIELYLTPSEEIEQLRGTNNLNSEDTCGVRVQAKLSQDFNEEYQKFIETPEAVRLVPTEYYRVDWLAFSGNGIAARSVPTAASVIDPSTIRLQYGVDYHLQQIIDTHLEPGERVELSREYRSLREEFAEKEAVKTINRRLQSEQNDITDRELSLSIDISQRYTWESSLVAHLDNLPFQFIGKGEQNAVKTLLAIGRKTDDVQIVLIEEPETHLSFASLRRLIARVEEACVEQQVIIATHSTYVLNKLGLQNLVLLGGGASTRISDLEQETIEYFKRLAGFDTLRLVLAKGVILVEGPSDELIVQRAYIDANDRLPIEDGIDVISVGLSHKRFLDLAIRLGRRTWIVTDNDHKTLAEVQTRFAKYTKHSFISLHTGSDPRLNTLEPNIVEVNALSTLNEALSSNYETKQQAVDGMQRDKPGSALAIFESDTCITMPNYITDVVNT